MCLDCEHARRCHEPYTTYVHANLLNNVRIYTKVYNIHMYHTIYLYIYNIQHVYTTHTHTYIFMENQSFIMNAQFLINLTLCVVDAERMLLCCARPLFRYSCVYTMYTRAE